MKAFFLIFSIFILGCSSDDTPKEKLNNIPQELLGKWKIIEIYQTDGGSESQWRDEDTGAIYDYWFKENGEYYSNGGINNGFYELSQENKIIFNSQQQNSRTILIEYLNTNSLILNKLNFEVFKEKLIKIDSE